MMAFNPFLFNTHDLPRRPGEMREYFLEIDDHDPMGFDVISIPDYEPIDIELKLESVSDGILVSASIQAEAVGECTRCLDPVEFSIDESFQELFEYEVDYRQQPKKKKGEPVEDPLDETADEVKQMVGEIIDLEPCVRDAIILNLPINPLCDPDCPGLCPECGIKWTLLPEDHAHATADIRWAGLEGWKSPEA
ncbi:MAG: YceD family protein [Actinomycetes bacterium]